VEKLISLRALCTLSKNIYNNKFFNIKSGIIDDSFKNSEWKDLEGNLESFRKNYEGYIEKLKNEKSK